MQSMHIGLHAVKTTAILAASAAFCALGLPLQAQIYTSYVFQGTSDGTTPLGFGGSNFIGTVDAPLPFGGITPNYSFSNNEELYLNPNNSITTSFTASAAAAGKGNWSSGLSASGSITNGYYPGDAQIGTKTPPFGYYVQSAFGTASSVTFETPGAIADAQAQMHWHVSGTANATLGTATTRLDFDVTTNPVSSVSDLFNPSIAPNPLEEFGFGNYSYNVPITIGQTQNFLFWSSAFYEVNPGDLPDTPQDFSGFVAASDTFSLDSISLMDGSGNPISDWNLVDNATGDVIWNQDGRVEATPEPGSATLLTVLCVTGLAARRRRRSKGSPRK